MDEFQAALESSSTPNRSPLLGDELGASLHNGHILIKPTSAQLVNNPHLYSLDISPHLLYGAGPTISILLGSGAHHYTEYKLLQGTVLHSSSTSNTGILSQPVPSTRAEIFRDKTLSPLQKRTLMRFIKGLAEAMEGKGPFADVFSQDGGQETMLFSEFMAKEGLDDVHLQRCLAHGVLLQHSNLNNNETLTCYKAMELFKLYIESVGRYGIDAGPFLTPLYGCGELPQAFCRSAAVSGAVQILRCTISDLIFSSMTSSMTSSISDDKSSEDTNTTCIEIQVEENSKQIIKANKIAAGPGMLKQYIEKFNIPTETVVTHRCLAIVDAPVEVDKAQALLIFPEAGPDGSTVWALQLSHSTAVCPEGHIVLHLWCCGGEDFESEKYLMPCLESVADCSPIINGQQQEEDDGKEEQRPRVLFAACFSLETVKPTANTNTWPANVVLCQGPSADVTFASAVADAKQCYWQLFRSSARVEGEEMAGSGLLFPLDEAVVRAQEDNSAVNDETQQEQKEDGGSDDVDSDDEALQALKAALELLPSV